VWITTFFLAVRLTMVVDKALTTATSLDTTLTVTSPVEISVLQGFRGLA